MILKGFSGRGLKGACTGDNSDVSEQGRLACQEVYLQVHCIDKALTWVADLTCVPNHTLGMSKAG